MNFADYFNPSDAMPNPLGLSKNSSVFGKVQVYGMSKKVEIGSKTLAIIGVGESRNSNNPSANQSPDAIRKYLYGLSGACIKKPIVDLGNLKPTPSPVDTYMAIRDVVSELVSKGVTILVLGGTQEITWPIFMGISEHKDLINLSLIDHTIDMGNEQGDFSSTCFIDRIVSESPSKLFSLNMLGYQGYLTSLEHIDILTKRNDELARLGFVRSSMAEVEPTLRDSDIVSLDMGCIRQGDSPGSISPSPNGFYAEEVCQLARYSGLSNQVKVFGIFELNISSDPSNQSSHLAAQILWHFIDAFNARSSNAQISLSNSNIKRYIVSGAIPDIDMVFLHNPANDTWWMEMPETKEFSSNNLVFACSYNDYKQASQGDVPDRWIRIWRKLK